MLTPNPCPGGVGLRDGRGYGPFQRGYYHYQDGIYAPFGPNCERLRPMAEWDAAHQGQFGAAELVPTIPEAQARRNTRNAVIATLLGVSGAVMLWVTYPERQR